MAASTPTSGKATASGSVAAFDLRSAAGRATGVGRYLPVHRPGGDRPRRRPCPGLSGKTDLDLPPRVEKVSIASPGRGGTCPCGSTCGSPGRRVRFDQPRGTRASGGQGIVGRTGLELLSCAAIPAAAHPPLRASAARPVVRRHPLIFGSEAAACDVKDLFGRAAGTVVPPWFPRNAEIQENEPALTRLGVRKPYVLVVRQWNLSARTSLLPFES